MITGVTMEETRFTDSIERLTMTASLGSVAGIDVFDADTVSDCFIFDELLELIITPSAKHAVEPSASTLALDTLEVLHYNSSCCAVVPDNIFTDDVVHISHKQFLPATETFEVSLGRLCAFTLETATESIDTFESGLHATIESPVGCNSEFAYTNINPDQVCAESEFNVFGNKNMYEIIFTFLNDVSPACSPIDILQEVFRDLNGDFESAVNSGNTDNAFIEFRPEVADVVSDRNVLHPFGFPVLCNDFDCLTGQLGWQFGFSSDNRITFIVETFEPPDMTVFESNPNCFIEFSICFRNRIVNWEFDSYNCFGTHSYNIEHLSLNNYKKTESQFLHRMNTVASLRPKCDG